MSIYWAILAVNVYIYIIINFIYYVQFKRSPRENYEYYRIKQQIYFYKNFYVNYNQKKT